MSINNVDFENPHDLPIENLTLTVKNTGVVQQIKALDPHWADKRILTMYERPPIGNAIVIGAIDAWKAKMGIYKQNLKWLLSLEYHRFWSTVLYHPQCMDSLVSFLQEANPPYVRPHESRDVQSLYAEIRKLVLVVFSRLVTNKESSSQWMTKEFMGNILYNNFVFTIPIMWDICLTYGIDNGRHVARVLDSVFKLQPQYENDVAAAISYVNEALKYIILQVNRDYDSEEPPNLPETFKGFGDIKRPSTSKKPDRVSFEILRDLVMHLLDTAMTLRIFIEIHPDSVRTFRKCNFVNSIVQLYEYGIPQLYERLEEVGDKTSVSYTEVEGYLDYARTEIIDIFREILAVYKNAILSSEDSIANHVEEYLAVMMDGLQEKLLIKDYHLCYPVNEDLEMLRQAYPDIDTVKTDFIIQAIYSNLDEPVPEAISTNTAPETIVNGHVATTDNEPTPAIDEIPDNVKEESLISEVKDILPHLGDGFILKCLKHYGFNAARVINSILEDNLAKSLKSIDHSLPIIPEDPLDKKFLETGVQRLNVFDGDEFDIMTRDDVDLSRIHVGKKKSKYRDLKAMMDDKTEVRKMADVYSKYNLVCDVEEGMYSDEYDDTYDSDGVAPGHDPGDDAENQRRPFVTPMILRPNVRPVVQEESEESDNGEDHASSSKGRMDFCVNPEEIRARREASFQAKRGKSHKPSPQPAKSQDVTGKPKGQGQEKEVLANRDKKEKHKSSRANHNRRQGAQWKRSQGMMPS